MPDQRDKSDADGKMPWDENSLVPYVEDPMAAGAAMVLKRGLPLSGVTDDERGRFALAFYRAFIVLPPSTFAHLVEVRDDVLKHGQATADPDACHASGTAAQIKEMRQHPYAVAYNQAREAGMNAVEAWEAAEAAVKAPSEGT